MFRYRPYRSKIRFLRYLPDGRLLTVGGKSTAIGIWEPGNKQIQRKLSAGAVVLAITISSDGKLIAARTGSSRIFVWDEASGRLLSSMIWHAPTASELEFVPNTKRLCVASWNGVGEYEDPTETSVDFRRSDHIWDVRSAHYLSISISDDSRWMISSLASSNGPSLNELAIFDRLYNRRSSASTGEDHFQRVRFLPSSTLFLTEHLAVPECSLWSLNPFEKLRTFRVTQEAITDFSMTPDGQKLLTAGSEGRVVHWDLQRGEMLREFNWELGPLSAVAIAPDGLTYALGSDRGDVMICDLD